jgi:hypothetical protein
MPDALCPLYCFEGVLVPMKRNAEGIRKKLKRKIKSIIKT